MTTGRSRLVWIPVFLWAAGIAWASVSPRLRAPSGTDLGLHAFAYAVLALLLSLAMRRGLTTRGALVSAVAAWGYGLIIEGVQVALPYRTAEARDLIANAAGAVAPAAVSLLSRTGKEASR